MILNSYNFINRNIFCLGSSGPASGSGCLSRDRREKDFRSDNRWDGDGGKISFYRQEGNDPKNVIFEGDILYLVEKIVFKMWFSDFFPF